MRREIAQTQRLADAELVQSVDVDALVRKHLGRLAIPAHTLIPPGLLGYTSTHKIRPSSGYLAKAGSPGNIEWNAIINSVYEGPYTSLATDLLKTFRQRGFDIQNIGATRSEYYRALASATADLVVTRWICGTPEIDRLIEHARTESDPEIRNDIYREVEDIISQRALVLPLFHEQAYCFARPELEGFYVAFSTRSILPYEKLWVRR